MHSAAVKRLQLISVAPSIAARLQDQLKEAEQALDSTAGLAGELISKTIEAAQVAGIHRVHIQPHLKQLTASIDHALEGQMQLQRFHQACRTFMKKIDMETVGFGDVGDTPDPSTPPKTIRQDEPARAVA